MGERLRTQSGLNIEVVDVEQHEDQPTVSETERKANINSTKEHFLKVYNNCKYSLREAKERETTVIEKIIWLLMFTSCFIYCGILIWRSYSKWIKSPAIVMLTENDEPIREIPFPAVTVCPERKIMSEVFNFQHYIELSNNKTNVDLSDQVQNMYEDVSLICDYDRIPRNGRNVSVGNETVGNILKASTKLLKVMSLCTWKGKQRTCNSLFTPILTEEGMCFTFNTIGPEDLFQLENMHTDYEYMKKLNRTRNQGWTMENGYPFDAPRKTYPVRGSGAGVKAGLGLKLTEMEKGLDLTCKRRLSGFKILLHNPSDLPRPSQQYIRVPTFEDVTLSFTASLEFTSDGLEVFTPIGRRCYFADERSLKYFKLYTQSNCEYECLTNFTYARCRCVHFAMPLELSTMDIEDEGRGDVTTEEAIRIAEECNCLPACTSITYETEVTQTELHENERHEYKVVTGNNSHSGDIKTSKVSNVIIFFKRPLFDIFKRCELYGTSDILASCGGLLGLFMGFSVINIVEIVYLCFLSVYRRHKSDKCEQSNKENLHLKN
ncbi:pickpocket protein 28-like [Pararge aegeria]|uniref:pickpocket protein 28-like n=1 Tax=Pararge aegeria TaxID=116150 RepID=UPI0019D11AF3|nr:pickpocket protein 28-like [Pararge aegeria]